MTILIAEDNPISLKIIDKNLQRGGYLTLIAENGRDAYQLLEQHDDIELIITDIMMPEMNGLDLLKTIRKHPTYRSIPVIMCTVFSDFEMIKKAYKLGCSHYVTKPIVAGQLFDTVLSALGQNVTTETQETAVFSPNADTETKGVQLLVNAIQKTIPVLESHLEYSDYQQIIQDLSVLSDAAFLFQLQSITRLFDALDALTPDDDQSQFNFILTEMLGEVKKLQTILPSATTQSDRGGDGSVNLLNTVNRNDPQLIDALESLIRAQNEQGVRTIHVSELELGMQAYDDIWSTSGRLLVVKGQQIDEAVADRLVEFASKQNVVEPFRVIDPSFKGHVGQGGNMRADEENSDLPIDFAVGLDAVDGDIQFLKELVGEFIAAFPDEIKTLRSLYQTENTEQIQRVAHGLKGAAGNLGLTVVFELAYSLEKMGSESQLHGMERKLEQLENAVQSVNDFVDMYDW